MPFSTQQLYRIKRELGYHVLTINSLPFIGYSQIFDSVVQTSLDAEVTTTATLATAITATSEPVPQALTLASPTGFTAGSRVIVDVDTRVETSTIQSLSGSIITVQLMKAHSGTIPVTLEGPISMALEILRQIDQVRSEMSITFGEGAIKKVDEIEFYGQSEKSSFGLLGNQLMSWRDELAAILGVRNAWHSKASQGGNRSVSMSVY